MPRFGSPPALAPLGLVLILALAASCSPPPADPGMPEVAAAAVSDVAGATIGGAITSRNLAIGPSLKVFVAWVETGGPTVRVSRSVDRGRSFLPSAPVFTLPATADPPEVAVAAGAAEHVYLAFVDDAGDLRFARSTDGGATWGTADVIAPGPFRTGEPPDQVSLAAAGDLVLVALARTAGTVLLRSDDRGVHFTEVLTPVEAMAFWDVLIDPQDGSVIVIGDTPDVLHAVSVDGGATFGPRVESGVGVFFSDATIGPDGQVLVVGDGGVAYRWDRPANVWHDVGYGVPGLPGLTTPAIDLDGTIYLLAPGDGADVLAAVSTDGGGTYTTDTVAQGQEFDAAAAPHVAGLGFVVSEGGALRYHFVGPAQP